MTSERVYIETYGCQMNVLDSELLCTELLSAGFEITPDSEQADILLFNTCSVREKAEVRALSNAGAAAALRKRRPEVVVGIIGCMAEQRAEEIFENLPHVQIVAGPRRLRELPDAIREVRGCGERRTLLREKADRFLGGPASGAGRPRRFQSFVKAMEGCDMPCAYCVVPRTRGREQSRPMEEILEEVRRLADAGTVETTLLGQTIDAYGKGLRPRRTLADLLQAVNEVDGIRRIRFLTSHPALVTRELAGAMGRLSKVCPYLHLPAQSGSDRVLRAMKRLYTRGEYLEKISLLREAFPGLEVAGDFIVGFPGETEEDFAETVSLVREVEYQNLFVFQYSPRPGTVAAEMEDDVSRAEKKRRNHRILEVQKEIALRRNTGRIGSEMELLVEGPSKTNPERWTGRTLSFQIVNFDFPAGAPPEPGSFVPVWITGATDLSLRGKMGEREVDQ